VIVWAAIKRIHGNSYQNAADCRERFTPDASLES
jgi:hypothetical protein